MRASFRDISKPGSNSCTLLINEERSRERSILNGAVGERGEVLRISIFQPTPVSASPLINYSPRGVRGRERESGGERRREEKGGYLKIYYICLGTHSPVTKVANNSRDINLVPVSALVSRSM